MSKTSLNKDKASASDINAWGDFWAENARPASAPAGALRGAGQGGKTRAAQANSSGCLPDQWKVIETAQKRHWSDFARSLPAKGRMLDIATGDGRVMGWIKAARPNLRPIGVDRAATLPAPPSGTKSLAGVAMEALPFPDENFVAAVSQFGFEYGDVGAAAKETARVLEAGGRLALITHRADGPILKYNAARRDQILWVLDEQGLIDLAKRSLAMRSAGMAMLPPKIAAAPGLAHNRFGEGSAAWEISEAIRRSLVMGQNDTPAGVAQLLDTISAKARNEVGRIDSLERACATTSDEAGFEGALSAAGFAREQMEPIIAEQHENPIADFRVYRLV